MGTVRLGRSATNHGSLVAIDVEFGFLEQYLLADWRDHLVVVSDGATCYWLALFGPTTKTFVTLKINARG
jgi:hypothetical protein